jgi:sulfonate transport system ATP-binding protein
VATLVQRDIAVGASSPAVRVRGLARSFFPGPRVVLDGLDLDIAPGEFVALLGRSGSGKTTLLRSLAGLDPVERGVVTVPPARAAVFQEPRLLPWMRVWRNVSLGLPGGRQARAAAVAALAEVGLESRADAWPLVLSGGEAQRVALARALTRRPQLLLLDEPFASLDALTRIQMHALVAGLIRTHQPAVLLVTHDVDEALLLADRAVVLRAGRLAAEFRIDVPEPRRGHPSLAALRADLLGQLGVVEQATVVRQAHHERVTADTAHHELVEGAA